MEEKLLAEIAALVKKAIIAQLNIPRPVLTYAGQQKTVGGNPVPQSPPKASGNLIANTNVYWKEGFEQGKPELIVEMPDYYFFVENGRRPGKYPPLAKVRQWAQVKKGISRYRDKKGRFIKRRSFAFAIQTNIKKFGIRPSNFLDKAVNLLETDQRILDALGEEAFEELINRLEGI